MIFSHRSVKRLIISERNRTDKNPAISVSDVQISQDAIKYLSNKMEAFGRKLVRLALLHHTEKRLLKKDLEKVLDSRTAVYRVIPKK